MEGDRKKSQSGWEALGVSKEGLGASLGGTDEQTDERTDRKSPHYKGLRPLPGPLPNKGL